MNKEISKILNESSIFTLRDFGSFIGVTNSSGVKKDVLINSIVEVLDTPTFQEGSKKGRKHMTGLRGLLDKLSEFDEFKPHKEMYEEYRQIESEAKQLKENYQTNMLGKKAEVTKEQSPKTEATSQEKSAEIKSELEIFASQTFVLDGEDEKPTTAVDHNGIEFVPSQKILSESIPLIPTDEPAMVADVESKVTTQTECEGYLEVIPDKGFGFIRTGEFDVYISGALINKMCLKAGDFVKALYSERSPGKYAAFFIKGVNRKSVDDAFKRVSFENLRATFPTEKFNMISDDNAVRAIDLFAPIGKGQRALIVSPPKSGKTTIIKNLAKAIKAGNPETKIFILLIDERPEEVTDMQVADCGDVVFSAFDDKPDRHIKIAIALLEKAKRLVENGEDVVILMDSLTRFARAVNMSVINSSRSLSGGMDASALQTVKTFFGSGRNTSDGGSLTLIATALVDTNSKMDDLIFEEFKGTGNCEVVLDRSLSEKRIFPAIDINKSGTRRDELLFSAEDYTSVSTLRKYLATKQRSGMENVIELFDKIKTNDELLKRLPLLFDALKKK
ncbi:MAG: transcription termination factor Rho [Bacillota bacterium]